MPDNNEVQGAAIDHRFIPAPVVPIDDQRCAFPNSQWGTCGIPESDHADLMEPLVGSRFHHEYQHPAPPTPSQDAEGDDIAMLAESFWAAEEGDKEPALGRLVSAIRAPYEELVKGVHSEFDDLVVACRAVDTASATPGMIQETIDAIARMSTVLARITGNNSSLYNTADAALESLGGRKDG